MISCTWAGHKKTVADVSVVLAKWWAEIRVSQGKISKWPINVRSGIFIHPAIWPQQTWAENWGLCPLGGSWVPIWHNVARAESYLDAKFHLDPSNRLATIHQRHRQTGWTDNGPVANGQPTTSYRAVNCNTVGRDFLVLCLNICLWHLNGIPDLLTAVVDRCLLMNR